MLSTLLPGTYPLTASFAGNANLVSASASLTETVTMSASTTALSAAPSPGYAGQPVTLKAMVTALDTLVPTGETVTFYDGTTVLGTGTLDQSRSATLTTSTLAIGTHALTASYPGTSVFTGSYPPRQMRRFWLPAFTIALSPTTITVKGDQTATVAIQLASIGRTAYPGLRDADRKCLGKYPAVYRDSDGRWQRLRNAESKYGSVEHNRDKAFKAATLYGMASRACGGAGPASSPPQAAAGPAAGSSILPLAGARCYLAADRHGLRQQLLHASVGRSRNLPETDNGNRRHQNKQTATLTLVVSPQ